MADKNPQFENVYLTASQVLARYGRRNHVWLHRRLKDDPAFPKPIYIAEQRYWSLAELVAYELAPERRIAPMLGGQRGKAATLAAALPPAE